MHYRPLSPLMWLYSVTSTAGNKLLLLEPPSRMLKDNPMCEVGVYKRVISV